MRLPTPLLLSMLACAACGTTSDSGSTHSIAPTYSEIEAKVFATGCATSSCHSTTGRAGGLDLSAGKGFGALVNVPAKNEKAQSLGLMRVTPGDPSRSFLFTKVSHGPLDAELKATMPPIGDPLDADSLWAIETWISTGAKHD